MYGSTPPQVQEQELDSIDEYISHFWKLTGVIEPPNSNPIACGWDLEEGTLASQRRQAFQLVTSLFLRGCVYLMIVSHTLEDLDESESRNPFPPTVPFLQRHKDTIPAWFTEDRVMRVTALMEIAGWRPLFDTPTEIIQRDHPQAFEWALRLTFSDDIGICVHFAPVLV